MDTIYKYALPASRVELDMPQGAQPIHVATQAGKLTLWARVNPALPAEKRVFRVYGTGHGIQERVAHVGTCFDGDYVWHVFEELTS